MNRDFKLLSWQEEMLIAMKKGKNIGWKYPTLFGRNTFIKYIKKYYPDLYKKYFTIKYNPKKINGNKLNGIAILDDYIPKDMEIRIINNNEGDNINKVYLTKEQVKDLEQLGSINVPIN